MNVSEIIKKLGADAVALPSPEREAEGGYCGDFLSHVISGLPNGAVWFTVMNNLNVAAVASLADAALVVLCDGVRPDPELTERALAKNINLAVCRLSVFDAARSV